MRGETITAGDLGLMTYVGSAAEAWERIDAWKSDR